MRVEGFPADGKRSARRLIEQAAAMISGDDGGKAAALVDALFAQAAPEDLTGYLPEDLAVLADRAYAFFSVRKPGAPKIRFVEAPANSDKLKAISVIEIVNDDMPFLVDSVMAELAARNVSVRLVAHPVLGVERDASGKLLSLASDAKRAGARESFIHIHVDRDDDEARRHDLVQGLEQTLADVRVSVADWRAILDRVGGMIADLKATPPALPADEIDEAVQFLEWLVADNFTFLGAREYRFTTSGDPEPVAGSGLGTLRNPDVSELKAVAGQDVMLREMRAFLEEPKVLMIAKASLRSRVHRRVFMDYVSVKRFGGDGRVIGELRIVGLLTSTAYTRSTRSIPYIRRKVNAVIERAGFSSSGHSAKALANVLETYPRDELFQIDDKTLFEFAFAIMQLDERPRVRVLSRRDRFGRFVSILAFLPRDRATSDVIQLIGDFFGDIYQGHIGGLSLFLPESALVRAHFIVALSGQNNTEPAAAPDRATLEYGVSAIVRTWNDALMEQLALNFDPAKAKDLLIRYQDAFSPGYRSRYSPAAAISDIRVLEGLSAGRPLAVDFHSLPVAPHDEEANNVGLKVLSYDRPLPLSERVPVLENMGFRVVEERTSEITPASPDGGVVFLHDMVLERADGGKVDLERLRQPLESCFLVVMTGVAENDGYNALVLGAGLYWRDVALVRAISRFLRQVQVPFSQDYMWKTLYRHAAIAARLLGLFRVRFDPRLDISMEERGHHEAEIAAEIESALAKVESLDEDRILRHFVNAVQSALRTNFYQLDKDGQPKTLIAIKYRSRKLTTLPSPRPLYEIFVYSPRVEGVHLRFGKVARGGIRWSDRPQDFRTEILGLVKAQQVKNAVIVPVGAKGGFVPKRSPAGPREAVQAEGVASYKLFIESLLDITDNLSTDGIVPPPQVVRHDDDDPYLVVAADKGTATFSDIANEISQKRDFWLDDAFASGGSAGYDHKKMGITARGAWEAVKRHFREMDIDVGTTPFTVAGVGDMSGDVFGNGMLREQTIRLVAAFDHRDIFIDPDPDPVKSYAERKRLFDLPRSSWQDYDKSLISKGGGVYPRNAKEVPLSPEARAMLRIESSKPTPQEVMRAILKMQVDLLFFGGIGTYIRASTETDAAVGDRANDAIRVTGADLQCKVIGEGANLGMTQRGRIEAAFRGVRLNTDAIDNSAGVNTSDVEVNIKIALGNPVRTGQLTLEQRNALLTQMTDEVAQLVLRNNYQQTLAISLTERRGLEEVGFLQRLMQMLEARGALDRVVEFLPDDAEIADRRRRSQAFMRPELAVLLAYAKLTLFEDLIRTQVPDDPYLGRDLLRYFPQELSQRFPDALKQHRLRREIIATHLTNSMINRGGPALIARMTDETGAPAEKIAKAFAVVRDSYGMVALNSEIDALDNKIAGAVQLELYGAAQNLLLDRMVWFLRNVDLERGLEETIDHFGKGITEIEALLERALSEEGVSARSTRTAELKAAGVPDALARRMANLPALSAAPDIVLVAERTGKAIADVALTYFAARNFFKLDRITNAAREIAVSDYFDRLALDRARGALGEAMRRLTGEMLNAGEPGQAAVDAWVATHQGDVERIRTAVHEIADSGLTLSKLSVAASLLGDLAGK
ncbi:MAG: NAD-glutamate dehydrogenase [Pseudorhodoplanes sp.]|jgi:glutamate dehydrogenase|nr:NAD-glutamate dehydrogenase [Pseudorhodoplanes sp.]